MDGLASPQLVTAAWVVILLYMAVTLYLVIRGALKTKSIADYAVGSVTFSPVAVGLALAAAMTSAATFIINPGLIAYFGISAVISYGLVLPVAAMLSLVLLTKGFRKHGQSVKALTMAQWMGTRYQSPAFARFFAFVALLQVTFIVLILVGLVQILSKSLNVPEFYMLTGIVIFVFGYMAFGGANSMVYTNTIQALLMLVVAFILLGSGHEHFSNGIHGLLDKLAAIDPRLAQSTNTSSFLFRDFFEIYVAQIIVGVAIICQPHIITKSLLLKNDKDVNRYLIVAVVTQMIFFFVVVAGLYARLAFPDLMVNGAHLKVDQVMSAYVVKEFPVFVGLLVVMGLISAGISTIEGLIQSVSTTVTADIIRPFLGRFLPQEESKRAKSEIAINKLVIVVLAVVAILLSHRQLVHPKLSVAMFGQAGVYGYFAAAFMPLVFGMFFKKVPVIAPFTAAVVAILVHFIMYYGKVAIPLTRSSGENPAVAAATAIVTAAVTGLICYRLFRENPA
ncbi:MAG TPA: sodium:solute symporter [bacterium]|nr:sodium:solute symporter [bacterium]